MCCVSTCLHVCINMSENMCQHITVSFVCVCVSLGSVSEHMSILAYAHKYVACVNVCTLGKMSKCMNPKGMPYHICDYINMYEYVVCVSTYL